VIKANPREPAAACASVARARAARPMRRSTPRRSTIEEAGEAVDAGRGRDRLHWASPPSWSRSCGGARAAPRDRVGAGPFERLAAFASAGADVWRSGPSRIRPQRRTSPLSSDPSDLFRAVDPPSDIADALAASRDRRGGSARPVLLPAIGSTNDVPRASLAAGPRGDDRDRGDPDRGTGPARPDWFSPRAQASTCRS